MDLLEDASQIQGEIIKNRRRLHQRPELAYNEVKTAKFVAEKLSAMGIEVTEGVGGTGVLGVLKGKRKGRVVGLRADMDGLPVEEKANVEFKSLNKGVMHACGHDTHVAMLLGAASILAKHRDELHGTVKFFFQPAEEHGGRGGAMPMIEAGVMDKPKVDYVFGLHIAGPLKSGLFGLRPGAAMAAPDMFWIRVKGRGGHGSAPQETIDPIYIAAHVILALQGVSSRYIDPVKPFVISVGSIHSGTKGNVIPDEALMEGTIRTMDKENRKKAKALVKKTAIATAKAFGAGCEVDFIEDEYPITYNDPAVTERVAKLLPTIRGMKVHRMEPILGGEDFSRFLEKAPGTFYFLGTKNQSKGCIYPNHSSMFKVDEDVLKFGAASLAMLAMEFGGGK